MSLIFHQSQEKLKNESCFKLLEWGERRKQKGLCVKEAARDGITQNVMVLIRGGRLFIADLPGGDAAKEMNEGIKKKSCNYGR